MVALRLRAPSAVGVFAESPEFPTPTTAQTSVTQYGITWTFNTAYQVGQFVNGDYFVVNPGGGVVVNSVSPAPSSGNNGSQVNPTVGGSQALDSQASSYNASLAVSFPRTLTTGDSLISSISVTGSSQDWDGTSVDSHVEVETAAILTVVSQSPPVGTFRPSYVDRSQTLYNANDINDGILPRLNTSGMANPTTRGGMTALNYLKRGIQRPWLMWTFNFNARDIHPCQNMYGYHRAVGEYLSHLAAYMVSDKEIDDTLLIRTVQLGIDYYHIGLNGNGDSAYYVWPVVMAGALLGNDDMLSAFQENRIESVPRDYADFFYWDDPWNGASATDPGGHNPNNHANISVPVGQTYNGYTVFFRNNLGTNREYEHLTEAERNSYGMTEWTTDDGYRTSQDSWPHVGMVFSALVLGLTEEWNHDATFSYIDRWMLGEGRSAVSGFIDDLYAEYRSDYPSFPYLP